MLSGMLGDDDDEAGGNPFAFTSISRKARPHPPVPIGFTRHSSSVCRLGANIEWMVPYAYPAGGSIGAKKGAAGATRNVPACAETCRADPLCEAFDIGRGGRAGQNTCTHYNAGRQVIRAPSHHCCDCYVRDTAKFTNERFVASDDWMSSFVSDEVQGAIAESPEQPAAQDATESRDTRRGRRAANTTLHILLGDSMDREMVRSRCAKPVRWAPHDCAKCYGCWGSPGHDEWFNVFNFGVGSRDCYHSSAGWIGVNEPHNITTRVLYLVPKLLRRAHRHARVVIQMHSGLWDIAATGPSSSCRNTSLCENIVVRKGEPAQRVCRNSMMPFHTGEWQRDVRERLIAPVRQLVAGLSAGPPVSLRWRSIPYVCSMPAVFDPTQLTLLNVNFASALGVALACAEGLALADWRSDSCNANLPRPRDGIHFDRPEHYDGFARAAPKDACGTWQEPCEWRMCRPSARL